MRTLLIDLAIFTGMYLAAFIALAFIGIASEPKIVDIPPACPMVGDDCACGPQCSCCDYIARKRK